MVVNYPTVTQATKTNSAIDYEILGCFKNNLFYLRILVILSGLSIGLQTYKLINNTSDVNTLSRNESLEVEVGELRLKVTGRSTMDRVLNLLPTLKQ